MRASGSRRAYRASARREMTSPPLIRRALPGERDEVVRTVTAAFREDPAWRFLTDGEYERLAPQFAEALFELRAPPGNVWVNDDYATVAMWDAPRGGGKRSGFSEAVWPRYRALAGERAYDHLVAYNEAVAAVEPNERYWYLGVLGTDPEQRARGLATAVLAPVLAQADRDGVACCLETSTEANRRFYEHRGFVEATEVALAGGPPVWWMRRPAAPPGASR